MRWKAGDFLYLLKISEEYAFSHLFILYIWKPYNI